MNEFLGFVIILGLGGLCLSLKDNSAATCGYNSCHTTVSNKINVHIIPHSHDDVGWHKTVDQYFYGVSAGIGVNYIISSVMQAVKQDSNRRFVQVETAFFWKWWQDQPENIRNIYKELVNNGQIEIINGGWVMNDEACVNYQSTIDQFTLGLRKINETLGPCGVPRVGWQIDPFGHSREQASIFAQLGFDGAFFGRLDTHDKLKRMQDRTLDFMWQGSANLENSNIFYNAMMNHYGAPPGFCFDILCPDAPIIDDPESFEYNADQRMADFEEVLLEFANYSTTNNILIPMGGDFTYEQADKQFINIDRLISLFENHLIFNVIYSTPSCYIKAVNEASPELTLKTDDFFPYGSDEYSYWTGYFTSRPNSKRFERIAHNILQASKQLRSIFKLIKTSVNVSEVDSDPHLTSLQESVGVMQHHDAVSGTEEQHVANDYVRLLHEGITKSEQSVGYIIGSLLTSSSQYGFSNLTMSSCLLSNISICENSNKDRFVVVVYNPLSRSVNHFIHLPVNNDTFVITGPTGTETYDLVDAISDFSYVNLTNIQPSQKEIIFVARDVPPMGIKMYHVATGVSDNKAAKVLAYNKTMNVNVEAAADLTLGSSDVSFTLDKYTYLLKSVTMNNITLNITQQFYYYNSETGQNENIASGAYLFRPTKGTTNAKKVTEKYGTLDFHTSGRHVAEAHVTINDWIKQIIRVYKGEDLSYVEFDWLVGPVQVNETTLTGREIVSRFIVSDFNNSGVFYTDSNGREMIKRVRNERTDYSYDPSIEPIASNYYPVTSKIVIRDETRKLEVAVLNDRAQGGSSLRDGELELMVHRRTLVDDGKGVYEALNEQEFDQGVVVRGRHYLIIGSTEKTEEDKSLAAQERELALKKLLEPYVLLADATDDSGENITTLEYNFLVESLPDNVNILTFERWDDEENTYLLRLEHILEKDEDVNLSNNATIYLNNIFLSNTIVDVKETTLGGNQYLEDFNKITKFTWKIAGDSNISVERSTVKDDDPFIITLTPMQIRTFIIKLE